jgi:DNA-binding NtrC family response regulator
VLAVRRESDAVRVLRCGLRASGCPSVVVVDDAAEALRLVVGDPDIVFFEAALEPFEGVAVDVAIRIRNPKVPLVAFGPPVQGSLAFKLAAAGVLGYVDTPVSEEEIRRQLVALARLLDPLARVARVEVGVRDLKEAQRVLRLAMYDEALHRTGGSRRAAAKLLGVDRRAVQKMVSDLADGDDEVGAVEDSAPDHD